jgi:hypothetical protein
LCNETQEPARRTASLVFGRIYLIVVEWVKTAGARFKRDSTKKAVINPIIQSKTRYYCSRSYKLLTVYVLSVRNGINECAIILEESPFDVAHIKQITYSYYKQRFEPIAEEVIGEYLAGFRKGRTAMDHVVDMK